MTQFILKFAQNFAKCTWIACTVTLKDLGYERTRDFFHQKIYKRKKKKHLKVAAVGMETSFKAKKQEKRRKIIQKSVKAENRVWFIPGI